MELHRAFRAIIDATDAAGTPFWELPVAESRRLSKLGTLAISGEPEPVAAVLDRTVPGPVGPVPVRVYQPDGFGPHGVLVYFHGGGYVLCDLDTHDGLCRQLCNRGRCVVVAVDYRLAPEHPFPAGIDDAVAVTQWVQDHAAEFNGDRGRVAVGGDSAGANFAAVVALANLADRRDRLKLQVLIYPSTDRRGGYQSLIDNGEGYLLTTAAREWFHDCYIPAGADLEDWRLSPLCAPTIEGVAPAVVVTAEYDPLRDEGAAYAARLRSAAALVDHIDAAGMIHGFVQYAAVVPDVLAYLDEIGRHLRRALA